nr:hypothetical protein [Candidatus Sigynarchaeota archaeon]
ALVLDTTETPARTDSDLVASYEFSDVDGDLDTGTTIRWYCNGTEQPGLENRSVIDAAFTNRTETWYFTVEPSDGWVKGSICQSPSIFIENTAPNATSVSIHPASPSFTGNLSFTYMYEDADEDTEKGPGVRWFRNTVEQISLRNATIVGTALLVPGDSWIVEVTPYDWTSNGLAANSSAIVVGNVLPTLSHPGNSTILAGNDQGTINWTIVDPDPGESTWTVYRNGSSVDNGTWTDGQTIQIQIGQLAPGQYNFTIVASDEFGPAVIDEVIVTIAPQGNNIGAPADLILVVLVCTAGALGYHGFHGALKKKRMLQAG